MKRLFIMILAALLLAGTAACTQSMYYAGMTAIQVERTPDEAAAPMMVPLP